MRVAAKILHSSDLSLFKAHFDPDRSRQKAINLNKSVFIRCFYPGLKGHTEKIQVSLDLRGPGRLPTASHAQNATILLQQKNWRLDGRLIENPPGDDQRFASLADGDIALIGFEGDQRPTHVLLLLVSQDLDRALHGALKAKCGLEPTRQSSMRVVTEEQLQSLADVAADDSLSSFLSPETIEGALYGDVAKDVFPNDGRGPAISADTLRQRTEGAAKLGYFGEEAFEEWLRQLGHDEDTYAWVARSHATASYDFLVTRPHWNQEASQAHVDVKTTRGVMEKAFHMSHAEVRFAAQEPAYRIARVSQLTSDSAAVTILCGVSEFCEKLVRSGQPLRDMEVGIDSYLILPKSLRIEHQAQFTWDSGDEGE